MSIKVFIVVFRFVWLSMDHRGNLEIGARRGSIGERMEGKEGNKSAQGTQLGCNHALEISPI